MGRPIFLPPTLNSEKTINSGFFFTCHPPFSSTCFCKLVPAAGRFGSSSTVTSAMELGQIGLVWGGPSATSGCPAVPGLIFPELWAKGRPRAVLGRCSGASPPTTADGTEPCAGKEIFPKSVREGRPLSTSCLGSVSLCHISCDRCRKSFSAFMFPSPLLGKVIK